MLFLLPSPLRPRTLPVLSVLLSVLLASAACDDDLGDDPIARFVAALPTRATFDLDVPGEELDTVTAPLDLIEAPLIGEPSTLRPLTASVRYFLAQLTAEVSDGIERMTAGRPLLRLPERALWRVRFPDHERALFMRRDGGHFTFSLWNRALGERGAGTWRFLMFGRLTPDRDGEGRGALWIDLDNDRRPRSRGKMAVLWSMIGDARDLEVHVYDGTPDEQAVGRVTRSFRYHDDADGGLLAFDAGELDVHLFQADRDARERVRVFTRWNAARAMRSDYSAIGPDVTGDGYRVLIGGECWHPPDASVTYEKRVGIPRGGGDPVVLFERGERLSCPFPEAEAPIIAPPGGAPSMPEPPVELDDA